MYKNERRLKKTVLLDAVRWVMRDDFRVSVLHICWMELGNQCKLTRVMQHWDLSASTVEA